ncbi:MAG: filamentous hemagglutinin N-terminal domain-containing protein [Cyanobacteria bacterium J06558_2]
MAQFWRGFRQLPRINLPQGDLHQQTKDNLVSWGIFSGLSTWCVLCSPLAAQITPDGSLGTETTTINNVTEITGGTRANNNLFHSFQDFSISTGNIAFFNNALEISNIISRVTGGNLSNIDGLIRANGNANLILLNPQGISLGNNVALDIGGSFLGSTAKSIVFDDGRVFNTDLSTQPLLSVSTPLGLQLGRNSAPIQVSGIADSTSSLEVAPGNTFALVGNGINFTDKVITAEAGRIDLGSVAEGQVSITEIDAGWQLGYEGVTQFADVQLLDTALLNPNSLNLDSP